jgi:hypothetical protein
MKAPYEPKDRGGRRIRVGDRVRIVGVPDLTGMAPVCIKESLPVFQHLVGKYKRVASFDQFGCAWIDFAISKGKSRGMHGVAIEPFLLHIPQARKHKSTRRQGKAR